MRNANDTDETIKSFRVSKSLLERFNEVAKREHRTASAELRVLMERRIAEADDLKAAA